MGELGRILTEELGFEDRRWREIEELLGELAA